METLQKITTMDMQPKMMVVDNECCGLYLCVSRQEDGVTLELVAGEAKGFEPEVSGKYTFCHSEVEWVEVPESMVEKMKEFFSWKPYFMGYIKRGRPILGGFYFTMPDIELWSKVNDWLNEADQFAKSFVLLRYSNSEAIDLFGKLAAKHQELEKEMEMCYQTRFLPIVEEWKRLGLKFR